MNNFTALVRLGKDAEIRHTANGDPVVGFRAAYDNGYGDKKKTEWLDCSAWGERYTKVAPHLTKGSQVLVQGEVGTREHDGKTYLTLRVGDLQLAGKPKDGGTQPARPAAPSSNDEDPDDIPF